MSYAFTLMNLPVRGREVCSIWVTCRGVSRSCCHCVKRVLGRRETRRAASAYRAENSNTIMRIYDMDIWKRRGCYKNSAPALHTGPCDSLLAVYGSDSTNTENGRLSNFAHICILARPSNFVVIVPWRRAPTSRLLPNAYGVSVLFPRDIRSIEIFSPSDRFSRRRLAAAGGCNATLARDVATLERY